MLQIAIFFSHPTQHHAPLFRALAATGEVDLHVYYFHPGQALAKERLERELQKIQADIAKLEAKLGNGDFVSKAPQAVVEENRTRLEGLSDRRDKVEKNLAHLPPTA